LNNLFGVKADPKGAEATLENLILLFNEVETLVRKSFEGSGIDTGHTFKWEMAMREGVLEMEDIKKRIELGVEIAETLIKKLKG